MLFGISLLGVLYILYVLLVKGLLWKIILFFAGWVGIFVGIWIYFPAARIPDAVTISGVGFSWCSVVPTIICFLALLCTKDE